MSGKYKVSYKVYLEYDVLYIAIKIRGNGLRKKIVLPLGKCIKNTLYIRNGLTHEPDLEEFISLETQNPGLFKLIGKVNECALSPQACRDLIDSEFGGEIDNLVSEAADQIINENKKKEEEQRAFWDAAYSLCTSWLWYETLK